MASTTPGREALHDLSSEGLIDVDAFRTASVHRPTQKELEEVYELRRLRETHATYKIVRNIDDERLAAAARLQEPMEKEDDPGEWLVRNAEFHTVLTEACNSPRLESFLDTLRTSVALYVGMAIGTDHQRPCALSRRTNCSTVRRPRNTSHVIRPRLGARLSRTGLKLVEGDRGRGGL